MMNNTSNEHIYPCEECFGTGLVTSDMDKQCPYCNGQGTVTEEEFLASNIRKGNAVFQIMGDRDDIGLVMYFPEDEE